MTALLASLCCCGPPTGFASCSEITDELWAACPAEIFPSVSGIVRSSFNAGGDITGSHRHDFSFSAPWERTPSGTALRGYSPTFPGGGQNLGTYTITRLVGQGVPTQTVTIGNCIGCIGFTLALLRCIPGTDVWQLFFHFTTFGITIEYEKPINGCPTGGGWQHAGGTPECAVPPLPFVQCLEDIGQVTL